MAKNVAENLQDPGQLDLIAVLADEGGERIVAHALVDREDSTRMRHNAYVGIHVLRSHWRRGIGRQLAAAIDAWAREQKLRRLTGVVLAHNTRALRFATAAGFREELISPRYAVIDGRVVDQMRVVKFVNQTAECNS